ncbi:MAG: CIA30 family protein [Bacteroidetes bacterium]|nr:MAG: CIA30 family protein [Bacteroidota bacterium]
MKLLSTILFLSMISSPALIFDFNKNSNTQNWRIVNDGVMGGLSAGNFALNEEGHGRFWGEISLENNGGFSSLRYDFNEQSTEGFSKLKLRVKGDGKNYQVRIKHNSRDYYSYIYTFSTKGEWETIEVDLKDMRPSFRGRFLDMDNFDKDSMEELTFLIANKKEERFELLIDKIELE